jgi:hypothetical protein
MALRRMASVSAVDALAITRQIATQPNTSKATISISLACLKTALCRNKGEKEATHHLKGSNNILPDGTSEETTSDAEDEICW